jgi:threonine dehydrogenase-like Zn-dependent dehydrogenase
VRVDATTICGTDLRILAGDVPEVHPGSILGHEAVGTVDEAGDNWPTTSSATPPATARSRSSSPARKKRQTNEYTREEPASTDC